MGSKRKLFDKPFGILGFQNKPFWKASFQNSDIVAYGHYFKSADESKRLKNEEFNISMSYKVLIIIVLFFIS